MRSNRIVPQPFLFSLCVFGPLFAYADPFVGSEWVGSGTVVPVLRTPTFFPVTVIGGIYRDKHVTKMVSDLTVGGPAMVNGTTATIAYAGTFGRASAYSP